MFNFVKQNFIIILILSAAFLIRFYNISSTFFTSDEARITYRGYTLVTYREDELGRKPGFVFNSSYDYQLPIVSYIAALPALFFGKSDIGVRIPFIIIGCLIVFFTYKISKLFTGDIKVSYFAATIVAFSPMMIYSSKTPNTHIVMVLLTTAFVYSLIRQKNNLLMTFSIGILAFLTSKNSWFIIPVLTPFTLFFFRQNNTPVYLKRTITIIFIILAITVFLLYLNIPQGKRSLIENNFNIFFDLGIKNGINRLRGQGLQEGISGLFVKLLFNKLNFLVIGFLHWFSYMQPSIYFGDLNAIGVENFIRTGALSKILIVPTVLGLYLTIKKKDLIRILILVLVFIVTYPAIFLYPKYNQELVILTLPFIAIIIASGLVYMQKSFTVFVILLVLMEMALVSLNLPAVAKKNQEQRPYWIEPITQDVYLKTKEYNQVSVSDDLSSDFISFYELYSGFSLSNNYSDIEYPYKFHPYELEHLKLLVSDKSFDKCDSYKDKIFFLSNREYQKISQNLKFNILKSYKDGFGSDVGYMISDVWYPDKDKLCLK